MANEASRQLRDEIQELARRADRSLAFMEVCGTHTMAAFRSGLRSVLPPSIRLLSGPGCPVCVTDNAFIDLAVAVADTPGVSVATFGDMLRVPGSFASLEQARAAGADVRVVYSAADALKMAEALPSRRTVFLGIGFETTAPGTAWTIEEAARRGIANFGVLCAHKTMPGAMAALLAGGELRIDGFLCPGHVSAVIGSEPYEFICRDYAVPCVVAGFEPGDLLEAVAALARQVCEGRAEVEIQYSRSVQPEGNPAARTQLERVFEPCDVPWRGLGTIPGSGLRIRNEFRKHDAATWFEGIETPPPREHPGCICGDVLRGLRVPPDCPLFRRQCTPASPVGACMVSSEGTCAAYFRYTAASREENNLHG
ncbi:MAG: hydrogenase formation protein HypD [Kiritimatiellaeota bacterium]|nr:hydrogenase formation protein HypD [Kiritimatiellota bacterium]